jgi:hypothetical protein
MFQQQYGISQRCLDLLLQLYEERRPGWIVWREVYRAVQRLTRPDGGRDNLLFGHRRIRPRGVSRSLIPHLRSSLKTHRWIPFGAYLNQLLSR